MMPIESPYPERWWRAGCTAALALRLGPGYAVARRQESSPAPVATVKVACRIGPRVPSLPATRVAADLVPWGRGNFGGV
jgi:hypothetical protein